MTNLSTSAGVSSLEVCITNPTVIPADKRDCRPAGTRNGAAITMPYADPAIAWSFQSAFTTTSDVVVKTAAGTNLKNFLTQVIVTNTGVAANDFIIKDATTVRFRATIPIGACIPILIPLCFPTTNNSAINATLSAAGTMQATFIGYTGA
jgi:hypothetical protein